MEKDKTAINLQLGDNQIKNMSQEKFRNIVKNKTISFAIKNLNEIKVNHSKSQNLQFTKLSAATLAQQI